MQIVWLLSWLFVGYLGAMLLNRDWKRAVKEPLSNVIGIIAVAFGPVGFVVGLLVWVEYVCDNLDNLDKSDRLSKENKWIL